MTIMHSLQTPPAKSLTIKMKNKKGGGEKQMKVYQMIYTSVEHCLADPELGLSNVPGHRVYSCSQGLTRENIAELIRFSSYRLPKNNKTNYPKTFADPTVSQLFPKTFRTLRLSDGKLAAIQSVYAGYDINGEPGNFFAHALVFDEYGNDFFPEQYYGSELFRTYLTKEEHETQLVRYMPILENPIKPEAVNKEICEFIKEHTKELTYLINHAVTMLTSENLKNICISTPDAQTTEKYLVALKWLLPRDVSLNTGISTYNVYLPSDKQDKIVFHGTVKGNNNITDETIEARDNCIYIDFEKIDFSAVASSSLFRFDVKEIREEYARYNLTSISAYLDWFALTQNITFSGIGGKLLKFKRTAGDEAFAIRARELFKSIDDESMQDVRFEIAKVMYDNIDLFDEEIEKVTEIYVTNCINRLCQGENYDIETIFTDSPSLQRQIGVILGKLNEYMDCICDNFDTMGDRNKILVLEFIARLKHSAVFDSWAHMLGKKKKYISVLTELAMEELITGYGANMFSIPEGWLPEELYELIAYIDASTDDRRLSMGCVKYIVEHDDVNWENYGITITHRKKLPQEAEADSKTIKRLLSRVGYEPFKRATFETIKRDIMADLDENPSPFLISRLLGAFYMWQGAYGNQREAQRLAHRIKRLILELREKEPQCYNYMIAKLGIEIIESQGHYHEEIVSTQTMPDSFWNWFLIGAMRSKRDDKKMLSYIRIYEANKMRFNRLDIKNELRNVFKDEN